MGVVHSLKGDARVIAIKIAILDKIFDSLDDLDGVGDLID
jgi:hypothetical protein